MRIELALLFASLLAVAACAADSEPTCTDPKYGDGTCDLETTCAAPDIDCYALFPTQADAQAWYAANAVPGRPPAPASDPHFARMHDLLVRGWDAYQATHDVGALAQYTPQLVLVDSREPNAFALRDHTDHAGLAVMVHLGLLELDAPDDELLGVVMHEITHALQLHVFDEIRERTRHFYAAPANDEPFGIEQLDDPAVRDRAEKWLALAKEAGYLDDRELGGMPTTGPLSKVFVDTVVERAAAQPAACAASKPRFDALLDALARSLDPLSGGVTLTASDTNTIVDVLSQLARECFAGFTPDAITVVAARLGFDEPAFRASLPANLRMLVERHDFVSGMFNWLAERRGEMRAIEAASPTPWSRVRYFSTEEAADDSSVVTLDAVGLDAEGIGRFLPKVQAGLEMRCRPLVDSGAGIPYGEDLTDEHHATCWRAGNAHRFAQQIGGGPTGSPLARVPLGPPATHRAVIADPSPRYSE